MPSPHAVLAAAGLLALGACASPTYAPRVQTKDSAQERIDAGPRKTDVWGPNQRDPADPAIDAFCNAVLQLSPRPASVACLPLVTHELRSSKPWVSELGVDVADRVAGALRAKGFQGRAQGTAEVGLQLARANQDRATLSTLESVAANAERLGAELVVFGTIRRRDRVGAVDRDVLTCDLAAYDVGGKRISTTVRWDVPSDEPDFRRVWDLAQAESPWMPDSRWGVPMTAPTLASELSRVAGDLAGTLAKDIDPAKVQGAVYVAPLDASGFVRSLARLRAAQTSWAAELTRRTDEARAAGAAVDLSGSIILNGTQFPSLQAAEDYLATLSESLQTTDAARFGQAFAGMLGEQVLQRARGQGLRVQDVGFSRQSDAALVAGELASGGLARSAAARDALKAAGVGLVVAPRLEQVGDAFQIRAEAYDLAAGAVAASGSAPIPPALVPELKRALGTDELVPVGDAMRASSAWEKVYAAAKSGVVHVVGPEARGSGFVVRQDGLVLTNDHVVRAAGSPITVTLEGGAPLAARVVAQDPYWDLAALEVEGLPRDTHVFEFADDVHVGAEVAVLGHPRDSAGWVLTPGHVSSTTEAVATADGHTRPSLMYTCPTRQGSSGSPVLLADGRVAAVHSAGRVGQSLSGNDALTELTGFALGVPGAEARDFVAHTARP